MASRSRRNGSPRTERGKATEIPRRKQAQTLRHASSRTKQREATGFSRSEHTRNGGYNHDDPSLKAGNGGLTIWALQKMLQEKRYDELNRLFDNGLTMNSLPVGISAGGGGAAFDGASLFPWSIPFADLVPYGYWPMKNMGIDLINGWASRFALWLWRGKIFFSSNNKNVSQGRNRMRKSPFDLFSPFVPMAKFTTMLLDSHPVAPRAKSNLVVLNYSDPTTRAYLVEILATQIHGFDVMVAVKGKYGPVFVGKTWLGKYDDRGEFTAHDPSKIIGYYFLDFNEAAVSEQREYHLDGSEEEVLDPIPHVDN